MDRRGEREREREREREMHKSLPTIVYEYIYLIFFANITASKLNNYLSKLEHITLLDSYLH
jgi:hypothetical protein